MTLKVHCWKQRKWWKRDSGQLCSPPVPPARAGNRARVGARTTETLPAHACLDGRTFSRRRTECGNRGLRERQFSFRKTQWQTLWCQPRTRSTERETFDCLRSDQKTNKTHANCENRACKAGAQTYGGDERMVAQENKAKHKRHQERVMEIY